VLGIGGLGWGGFSAAKELTRKATKAEISAALAREIATRWQRLPAGKIFPATVSYQDSEGDDANATLVGIAPRIVCKDAVGPNVAQRLDSLGCSTMLRATYADQSGSLATTVAIGVMPSSDAAERAWQSLNPINPAQGLHAVAFSGTIVRNFGDAQRGAAGMDRNGPYVLLYTAGYTDGVPGRAARANPELAPLGSGVLTAIEYALLGHGSPCSMKDIKC
jgi:hypothetical protein